MIPGEYILGDEPIALNEGRVPITVRVVNSGDRPVQVGSHYHFAEANPALQFDRAVARGRRLGVPAGTSVRFEPGVERDVTLVHFAGARVAAGFRGEVRGPLDRRAGGHEAVEMEAAPMGEGSGLHSTPLPDGGPAPDPDIGSPPPSEIASPPPSEIASPPASGAGPAPAPGDNGTSSV